VVASGDATAEADVDHTVKLLVEGLEPDRSYWYRFTAGADTSPIGRARTLPQESAEPASLRLAFASCQSFANGWYTAWRDVAAQDLDAVVFLGDYIYESAQRPDPVRPLPAGPDAVLDLAGYRSRYEAARRDPHLAAAHAAHPWAVTWDDHEVVNDHAGTTVGAARRAAAYQAWWEHMPVRVPAPDGPGLAVHRALRWGSTLELLLLDTRQHRAAPPCGGGVVATSCADLADASRSVLGNEQEAWLLDRLGGAASAWTVLGSSVLLAPLEVVGQRNGDAWDGYPPARDRITAALEGLDAVVLTGDLHVQLVVDVQGPAGGVVASELVAPSISSRASSVFADFAELLVVVAPQVKHADIDRRGWLRCDVTPERWTATYREVLDVVDPASEVVDGPVFEVLPGRPGAVRR
jgi:alkaline phosphatase D